jgi:hypothetical protein
MRRGSAFTLLLAMAVLASPPPHVFAQPRDTVRYPAETTFMVIEAYFGGPCSSAGDCPSTRIYGDGRVHVHHPFSRDAGDFEAWLTLPDLDSLLRRFAADGLLALDLRAVKEQRAAAERRRAKETGGVPMAVDAATVTLTMHLVQCAPAGASVPENDYWRAISWYALAEDAKWYPEVKPIVRLNRAVSLLMDLTKSTVAASKSGATIVDLPSLQIN